MKRKAFIWFLVVAIFGIVAFGLWTVGNRYLVAQQPTATIKVRIGYIPILDCAQLYVASHLGYFVKNGLDVELVPMAGGPAIIQALSSNAIDIGFANLATIVFYEQAAQRLNHLAGGTRMDKNHSEAGLVVLADSGIKQISDLRGKTIAVNSRRNIVDLAILRTIKGSGLSAKDINLIELPFKDMETALRSKRIDAAPFPEPLLSIVLKTGGVTNLGDHFAIAFGEIYSTGYFSMPESEKITSTVIKNFNTAINEATENLNNPSRNTFEAISLVTKLSPETLESTGKPEFVNKIPESAFQQMKTWLVEEELLDNVEAMRGAGKSESFSKALESIHHKIKNWLEMLGGAAEKK
jgi:NitT/TauT family transport system substrate-binding protein